MTFALFTLLYIYIYTSLETLSRHTKVDHFIFQGSDFLSSAKKIFDFVKHMADN